ncbi:tetratricopeptide repeat protein [Caldithrix abyssi]
MKLKRIFILFLVSVFTSCSHLYHESSTGHLDDAQSHYLTGQRFLQGEEWVQAEIEFRKALDIKSGYAPALDGLAQLALQKNDLARAESWLNQIPETQSGWLPVYLTRARLKFKQGEYQKSLSQLKRIEDRVEQLRLDSLRVEIAALKLRNLIRLQRWTEARALISKYGTHLASNGGAEKPAIFPQEIKQIINTLPSEFSYLIFKKAVSRVELAEIITEWCPPAGDVPVSLWECDPPISFHAIRDLPTDKKEASAIRKVLGWHILWAFPDGRFYPKEYVTRGELAIVLQRLLAAGRPRLTGVGEKSVKYQDVPLNTPLWRAIREISIYHLIAPETGKRFRPEKKVSGMEIIRAFQKLKSL